MTQPFGKTYQVPPRFLYTKIQRSSGEQLKRLSSQARSVQLCDLDDENLEQIFSYLPLRDLVAVKQCSRRYQTIANTVIDQKIPSLQIEVRKFPSRIVTKFRKEITSLLLPSLGIKEMNQVLRLCPKLTKLSVNNLDPRVFTQPRLDELFGKLTELSIQKFWNVEKKYNTPIMRTMRSCKSLVKLTLKGCDSDRFLRVEYPQLREFCIEIDDENDFPSDEFTKFCQRNHFIKRLRMDIGTNEGIEIVGVLNLKCLEVLTITHSMESIFDANELAVIGQLADIQTLRHLKLVGIFEQIPTMNRLKQLQTLELRILNESWNPLDKSHLAEMSELSDLKQFILYQNGFSRLDLADIVHALFKWKRLDKLVISEFRQVLKDGVSHDERWYHCFTSACDERKVTIDVVLGYDPYVRRWIVGEQDILGVMKAVTDKIFCCSTN